MQPGNLLYGYSGDEECWSGKLACISGNTGED